MSKHTALIALVVNALVAGVPGTVLGQTEAASATQHPAVETRGQLGASLNNGGVQQSLEIVATMPMWRSTHPLLADAHLAIGATGAVTPAQARLGAWVELSPLSVLDVRVGFEPSRYFGTFDSLTGLGEYDEPFDKAARQRRGNAKSGVSSRTFISPALNLKVGHVLASTALGLEWWRSNVDALYFYEPTRDTLIDARGDRVTTVTSMLMYEIGHASAPLRIGAYHALTDVTDAPANRIQKTGIAVTKQFANSHLRIPRPSVTLLVGTYLEDHYKKGEWTAGVAIGFSR